MFILSLGTGESSNFNLNLQNISHYMMSGGLLSEILWQPWLGFLVILIIQHFLRNFFATGVREIPGPFLSKFTNLWRFLDVWKGHADATHIALHRKHGAYVRLGPNVISVSNLSDIKTIYGINKGYEKVQNFILCFLL